LAQCKDLSTDVIASVYGPVYWRIFPVYGEV
jgi:hypothetical protein